MAKISVQMATRVQSDVRDAIQAQAVAEHRTISQQTAKILSEYVHTRQAQAEKKDTLEPRASGVQQM